MDGEGIAKGTVECAWGGMEIQIHFPPSDAEAGLEARGRRRLASSDGLQSLLAAFWECLVERECCLEAGVSKAAASWARQSQTAVPNGSASQLSAVWMSSTTPDLEVLLSRKYRCTGNLEEKQAYCLLRTRCPILLHTGG